MPNYTPTEQFVRRLSEHQGRLYAYVLTILGNDNAADDVFQNTNVAIWQKASEYSEGTNFWAWISRVAYYEILAYRRDRSRDRHVFDDALLADIADIVAEESEALGGGMIALRRCIQKVSATDRDLIFAKYAQGGSVKRLAELRGKSPNAISQALFRIRKELAECMERDIGENTDD